MLRTNTIGEIDEKFVGKRVKLTGWIDVAREHGKVIFIDLRDRYGKVQCVIIQKNPDFEKVRKLTKESCILIEGDVNRRPKGSENKELSFLQTLIRNITKISVILLILDSIKVLYSDKKQRYTEKWSKTITENEK